MASCPKCLASIDIPVQFFGGLFTCPKCQGVYFLGFDGTPEQSTPHEPPQQFEAPAESPTGEPAYRPQQPTQYESQSEAIGQNLEQQTSDQPQNQFDSYSEPQEIPNYDQPVQQNPVMGLDDVVRYANADATSSPLSFKVCIQGLDLVQNINELKEVLADTKLQIKFEDLRKNILNGQLIIDKIQPAKAAILAQRLRALDLKMIWEQKIYD